MSTSCNECQENVLLKSEKCYQCFIKALQDNNTYQKWMSEYLISFLKLRDSNLTIADVHKDRIDCEFCGDTVSMIIYKLGLDTLHEGVIDPNSKFQSQFEDVHNKNFVFRMDIGSAWFMTHCMIVVGDYLLHSYYGMLPFQVIKLTQDLIDDINNRNFKGLLGFDNHGKDEDVIYCVP